MRLFGRFEWWRQDQLLPPDVWPQRSTQLLFKLLISERGRAFTQDELIEYLYPDHDPQKAARSLRSRVSQLRHLLEADLKKGRSSQFVLHQGKGSYRFDAQAPCWVDTEQFHQHLQVALAAEQAKQWMQALHDYEQAIELYRGDYLAEDPYEEWTIAPRERWREAYLAALGKAAELYARLRQYSQALAYCQRALDLQPWNESVCRQQMLYHYLAGEQQKAVQAYASCVQALQAHLQVAPARETEQLYQQILRREVEPLPPILPNNLPKPLTSFIGRERAVEELKRLLTTARLLTLSGVGGCGKTRLAIKVAENVLKEYGDGVWWVELTALTAAPLVMRSVASALNLREEPGRTLNDTLIGYLNTKKMLLVLDNCEHLVEACAQLTDHLLAACPNLQILVTSRQVLGVRGETIWRVSPLSIPPRQPLQALESLQQYEAVSLFIERARASRTEFALTKENTQAIADICSRLEGLPLAIELAAARVKVLAVEQIAQRLDDRFRLLTDDSRTTLPQQQTFRATMDWSFNFLSEAERILLRRLSVFSGGWTLEAAESVCTVRNRILRSGHALPQRKRSICSPTWWTSHSSW